MNNRGIHFTASTDHSWALANWEWVAGELAAMGIHWVKVLDDGAGSSKEICRRLIAMGIKVIVRLYRPRPNPGKLQGLATTVPRNPWLLSAANLSTVEALVAIGVEFFEVNNEPNVPEEWDPAAWQASSLADKAKIVAYNWMSDAENVIKRGGRPAFPALAPCGHTPEFGSVLWYEAMFKALQRYQPSVTSLFNRGAWLAVHVGPVNHFYRDNKGQWRFEYPYDPICQADKPGLTIYQDDNGLLGYRVPQKMLKDLFGVEPLILSTEGGIFAPKGGWEQKDSRYPGIDYQRHAEGTVQMFAWAQEHAPDLGTVCCWLIGNDKFGHPDPQWNQDAWYRKEVTLPVVEAMKATAMVDTVGLTERVRNAAWNQKGIPYNPDATFQKWARANSLGAPVTPEFDVPWGGRAYRAQGFDGAILWCEVGDWGNVQVLVW